MSIDPVQTDLSSSRPVSVKRPSTSPQRPRRPPKGSTPAHERCGVRKTAVGKEPPPSAHAGGPPTRAFAHFSARQGAVANSSLPSASAKRPLPSPFRSWRPPKSYCQPAGRFGVRRKALQPCTKLPAYAGEFWNLPRRAARAGADSPTAPARDGSRQRRCFFRSGTPLEHPARIG